MKIRSRKFSGRCARHKRYNPAIDGRGGIVGNCSRCCLLADIWETAMELNRLIRRADPNLDDSKRPRPVEAPAHDPRQLSLIPD